MKSDKILLDHGAGGKMSHHLTMDMILPIFDNPILADLNDGAIFELGGKRFAFSTDTYTVDPIFFREEISEIWPSMEPSTISPCVAHPPSI